MAAPRLPPLPPDAGSDGSAATQRSANQRGSWKSAPLLLLGATWPCPAQRERRSRPTYSGGCLRKKRVGGQRLEHANTPLTVGKWPWAAA